jgi:signal transduction histidine kinase
LSFARSLRTLAFLVTAVPMGIIGAAVLLVGWTLVPLLAITPAVVPVLIGFRAAVGWLARAEGVLARSLLGVPVRPPAATPVRRGGYWGRALDIVGDATFGRQQAYLLLRFVLGGALAIVVVVLLATAVGAIAMPLYYYSSHPEVAGWHVDTIWKALLFVPAGLAVLLLAGWLLRPLRALSRGLARGLLSDRPVTARSPEEIRRSRRRALLVHAGAYLAVNLLLILIWGVTTAGYFWPAWTLICLGLPLAIHAWVELLDERPALLGRRTTRPFAIHVGIYLSFSVFFVFVWLASGMGYFWPIWPIWPWGVAVLIHFFVQRGRRGELEERIEELETTRAGAVDLRDDELRRIERDLHDGAQARLVALGMSIGMAEQKLQADPEAARELLEDAQRGAREALEELRDLARGIHPPVLTDRGLEAAVATLADRNPLPVEISVDLVQRPPATVETAAYFVVSEALANASKHAGATCVQIAVRSLDGTLTVEVSDDGKGGADPAGTGLRGLERRVRALDGTLELTSPPGGPTTLRAELPCGS